MLKNIIVLFLFSLILFSLFSIFPAKVLAAASLSIYPATGSTNIGQTISVDVKIDTGGAATTGVDAVITFNPAVFSVSNVAWGTLYAGTQPNPTIDNANGKISLHPTVTSTAYAFTGSGVLATITFTGKASGTSPINFTCTDTTTQNDSNVWSGGNDIINCALNTGGSFTVGNAEGASPTPTTGENITGTETPTPGQLMDSGSTEWTIIFSGLGIFFFTFGLYFSLAKQH